MTEAKRTSYSFTDPKFPESATHTWEPQDDLPNYYKLRCPRCGSTRIALEGDRERIERSVTGKVPDFPDGTCFVIRHRCPNCHLTEWVCDIDGKEVEEEFTYRWFDKKSAMKWETEGKYAARERRRDYIDEQLHRQETWPPDPNKLLTSYELELFIRENRESENPEPDNEELRRAITENPDSDELRREYADWLRRQPAAQGGLYKPEAKAQFIEEQLAISDAYRADPTFDCTEMRKAMPTQRNPDVLDEDYVFRLPCATHSWTRGFLSGVAMKTKWFLHYRNDLFRLAPIQHLELTYVKPHLRELIAVPQLAQLHTLRFPDRYDFNQYMRLNELDAASYVTLASSPYLTNLYTLALDDQDVNSSLIAALALSPYLTSLSFLDMWTFPERNSAAFTGSLFSTPGKGFDVIPKFVADWEATFGYLPFLHPRELYGVERPTFDRVEAHPVGKASFRPDIAARTRPRLPAELITAITDRIDRAAGTVRDAGLVAQLPAGRLVATLEKVEKEADKYYNEDQFVYVTMSVQVAPEGVAVYDFLSKQNTTLAARSTVKLMVPTFLVPIG